jgi:hypothetical protein
VPAIANRPVITHAEVPICTGRRWLTLVVLERRFVVALGAPIDAEYASPRRRSVACGYADRSYAASSTLHSGGSNLVETYASSMVLSPSV